MREADDIMDMLALARADVARRADLGGSKERWWVYGAGKMGRRVAKALVESGRTVEGFIDPAKQGMFDGLECVGIEQALAKFGSKLPVALGLHNPMVDAGAVKKRLEAAGFESVWMPQELVEALAGIANFWLAPMGASSDLDAGMVNTSLECLGDDASREALVAIARWRWLGDSSALGAPDIAGQYDPAGLSCVPRRLRMIDCGAYVGDTLEYMVKRGFEIEWYVGLEPDSANYGRLAATAAKQANACLALPCGAWSDARMLTFVPDDAAGSVRTDGALVEGSVGIQTLAIDDAFYSARPNYIKMDIEGAETQALVGARGCIADFRPSLAVSSYHHPMDLWSLPTHMKSLMMGRNGKVPNMALRCHAMSSFDSVLYAWS